MQPRQHVLWLPPSKEERKARGQLRMAITVSLLRLLFTTLFFQQITN
jgi:hypothetical protein